MSISIEQLYSLIHEGPLDDGQTISHSLMKNLSKWGLAERDKETEKWIVTQLGQIFWQRILSKEFDIQLEIIIK